MYEPLYVPRAQPRLAPAPHKTLQFEGFIAQNFAAFRALATQRLEHSRAHEAQTQLLWLVREQIALTDAHIPLFLALQRDPLREPRDDAFMRAHSRFLHGHFSRLLHRAQERGELCGFDIPFTAAALVRSLAPHTLTHQRHDLHLSLKQVTENVTQIVAP
jgi:hypothetical protein